MDKDLLSLLNGTDYYHAELPKSLGREWVDEYFLPVVNSVPLSIEDKFHTLYYHIAFQIAEVFEKNNIKNVFITGGGAYNKFLLECISNISKTNQIIPDNFTIEFKEALIFAFLGLLRYRNSFNTIASVTGAKRNSIGGALYMS